MIQPDAVPGEVPAEKLKDILPLLFIIVAAFIMRYAGTGSHSLSVDEAGTWLVSARPLAQIVPFMDSTSEVHPPLYFYFMHLWMQLGVQEWLMRLSSVLCGVASVAVTYLLARDLLDRQRALLAAFLMAFSSFHITYSGELRMYPLLTLLFPLSFFAFNRWLKSGSIFYFILMAAVNIIALYTHYLTVLILLIEALSFITCYGEHKKLLFPMICGQFLAAGALAPWIFHYMAQSRFQDFSLRFVPTLQHIFILFFQMGAGINFPPSSFMFGPVEINSGVLPGLILAAAVTAGIILIEKQKRVFIVLYLAVPLLFIFMLSRFTAIRIFEYKYFMIIMPVVCISLGSLFSHVKNRVIFSSCLVIYLGINLFSWGNYLIDGRYGPQNWKLAGHILRHYGRKGDLLMVHPSMMSGGIYYYYSGDMEIRPIDTFDDKRLKDELVKYRRVWFCSTPFHPYVIRTGLDRWLSGNYKESSCTVIPEKSFFPSNVVQIKTYEMKDGT